MILPKNSNITKIYQISKFSKIAKKKSTVSKISKMSKKSTRGGGNFPFFLCAYIVSECISEHVSYQNFPGEAPRTPTSRRGTPSRTHPASGAVRPRILGRSATSAPRPRLRARLVSKMETPPQEILGAPLLLAAGRLPGAYFLNKKVNFGEEYIQECNVMIYLI